MPAHDEFRELGALAAIGQITASEHEDLSAHLRECPECREAYADYSRILRQDLPQADPARFRSKQSSLHPATDAELRERFLARARAHGADFSPSVEQRITPDRKSAPVLRMRLAVAGAAAVFAIAAGLTFAFVLHEKKITEARPANPAPLVSQNESLQKQLDEATQKVVALSNEVSALSAHDGDLTSALKEKDGRLAEAKHNLDQLSTELDQMRTQNSTLVAARAQDQSVTAELKNRVRTLDGSNASSVAAMVELQDKIHLLNAALEQQSEKLAMESQLTSVSSDVRQLMGARNLHIIDVHDVNGSGKSAKSFGRVFYSEGQSVVFYAFDLPNGKLTPAKYYFEAWGQQEGQAQSVRNLGTFSIDDREQHRWVLKVTDASLLRGMDSVFVTAETVGDVSGPRGKRVLYAYLAGRPNHP
jgi:hypothetical protein